jgi:hypothetical protein
VIRVIRRAGPLLLTGEFGAPQPSVLFAALRESGEPAPRHKVVLRGSRSCGLGGLSGIYFRTFRGHMHESCSG